MSAATTTSDEIISCARTLIVAGGYNGFSYADIAEVVGVRKASIHYHFPTKLDLVRTLLQRYHEEFEAGIAGMEHHSPDPMDRLRAYIDYWAGCIDDPTTSFCVCALLASEIPLLPPDIARELKIHFQALSAWLAAILEQAADQGRIVLTGPTHAEAETLMATVHGAMLSARAYGDTGVFRIITNSLLERLATSR